MNHRSHAAFSVFDHAVAIGLAVAFLCHGLPPAVAAGQAPGSAGSAQDLGLRIVVLEGEDSVNIVAQGTAVPTVVEVRDRNDLPVAGVPVVFALEGAGATATLNAGLSQVAVTTNALGQAAVTVNPLASGAVNLTVNAAFQGQTATATIVQTNFATLAEAAAAGVTPTGGGTGGGGGGAGTAGGATAAGAAGGGLGIAAILGIVGAGVGAVVAGVALAGGGGGSGDAGGSGDDRGGSQPDPVNVTGRWTNTEPAGYRSSVTGAELYQSGTRLSGTIYAPTRDNITPSGKSVWSVEYSGVECANGAYPCHFWLRTESVRQQDVEQGCFLLEGTVESRSRMLAEWGQGINREHCTLPPPYDFRQRHQTATVWVREQ